jgi:hypothetical protein
MARFEEKIEINASGKTVFNIISDNLKYPKWNLIVDETKKIDENKFDVTTKMGKFFVIPKEAIPNERFTVVHEGSPFNEVGEIIVPKAEGVEVTLWADIKDEKQEKMLRKSGETWLQSLKVYAEYIEEGHNPDDFTKKEILISP